MSFLVFIAWGGGCSYSYHYHRALGYGACRSIWEAATWPFELGFRVVRWAMEEKT